MPPKNFISTIRNFLSSTSPSLVSAATSRRDWSTGTEDGEEHTLTLHVWTEGGSRRQAQEIMSALKSRLDDAPLALADHRLVGLRHELSEARREAETELFHGIVRYRAVTEPVN